MRRREMLRGVTVVGVGLTLGRGAETVVGEESSDAAARIRRAAGAGLAMERRDWEQGILAQAFLEAGDDEEVIRLTKAAIVQREADGRLAVVVEGGPTDPAMGGGGDYGRCWDSRGGARIVGMDFEEGATGGGWDFVSRVQGAAGLVGWI